MKIIRKAERNLLQAMMKSINSLLDNNAKQGDLCRSQLVSIISTMSMLECQELIDKVREFSYLKVRERQISKFNRLLQKEGNMTWSSIPPNPPQPGSSAGPASTPSQPGRSVGRAGTHSQTGSINPPKLGRSASRPGTHSQEGSINPPSWEGVQAVQVLISRQAALIPPSAKKECRQCRNSFPGRPEAQSQSRCLWCYSRGCCFFPRQYIRHHWGTRAVTQRAGTLAPFSAGTHPT